MSPDENYQRSEYNQSQMKVKEDKEVTNKFKWGSDPQFSGPRDWFRNSLILHEVELRKHKGNLLDFGCGSGNLILRVKNSFSCLGVDSSGQAVKYANRQLKNRQGKNSIIIKQENDHFLFKTAKRFDVIVSGEVLEHLKADKQAVKGFYRVLKPGGICVVSVPAHMLLWDITDDYADHFRRYSLKELKGLFEAAGFKVENVYYYGFPLTLCWHRFIFLPLFKSGVERKSIYTGSSTFFGRILASDLLKKLFSIPFRLDNLFNWTNLGNGLILVAVK